MPRVKQHVSTSKIILLTPLIERQTAWKWYATFKDKSDLDLPDIAAEVSFIQGSILVKGLVILVGFNI